MNNPTTENEINIYEILSHATNKEFPPVLNDLLSKLIELNNFSTNSDKIFIELSIDQIKEILSFEEKQVFTDDDCRKVLHQLSKNYDFDLGISNYSIQTGISEYIEDQLFSKKIFYCSKCNTYYTIETNLQDHFCKRK